jgi:hypothetical protein
MITDLRTLARALNGEVSGGQVLAPGPGHGPKDRSLCVKLSATAPDGFVVFSHAGDDVGACKDYVRARLGLDPDGWKRGSQATRKPRQRPAPPPKSEDDERREAFARQEIARIVDELDPVLGSRGELYLRETRRIDVDAIADVLKRTDALGWHHWLRFDQADPAKSFHRLHKKFFGCIVGVMTNPAGEPTGGLSRTYITADLQKLGKAKSWGPAGIVRLSRDEDVAGGLGIAEGIETALAAMARGFRPMWSTGSTAMMAKFPLLPAIQSLTLFADHDQNGAGLKAAQEAQARWLAEGREARVFMTNELGDINDLDLRDVGEDAP